MRHLALLVVAAGIAVTASATQMSEVGVWVSGAHFHAQEVTPFAYTLQRRIGYGVSYDRWVSRNLSIDFGVQQLSAQVRETPPSSTKLRA